MGGTPNTLLQAIVPTNPSVPVQPVLLASQQEPGMFDFFRHFPWVLESYRYHNLDEVLASLDDKVVLPAEKAKNDWGRWGEYGRRNPPDCGLLTSNGRYHHEYHDH